MLFWRKWESTSVVYRQKYHFLSLSKNQQLLAVLAFKEIGFFVSHKFLTILNRVGFTAFLMGVFLPFKATPHPKSLFPLFQVSAAELKVILDRWEVIMLCDDSVWATAHCVLLGPKYALKKKGFSCDAYPVDESYASPGHNSNSCVMTAYEPLQAHVVHRTKVN